VLCIKVDAKLNIDKEFGAFINIELEFSIKYLFNNELTYSSNIFLEKEQIST